jgi:hypothetical protein
MEVVEEGQDVIPVMDIAEAITDTLTLTLQLPYAVTAIIQAVIQVSMTGKIYRKPLFVIPATAPVVPLMG